MKADWRKKLVSEAMQAFSTDLNYAVAVVTSRKPVAQPKQIVWGAPPRFIRSTAPLGTTSSGSVR